MHILKLCPVVMYTATVYDDTGMPAPPILPAQPITSFIADGRLVSHPIKAQVPSKQPLTDRAHGHESGHRLHAVQWARPIEHFLFSQPTVERFQIIVLLFILNTGREKGSERERGGGGVHSP